MALRRWCIALASLAIAAAPAVATAASGPAAAATAVARPVSASAHAVVVRGPMEHGTRPLHLHGGIDHSVTSTNWSGYAANGGTYSSVSASWVEPAATCSSGSQYSSFWVGLDGYSSNSVEQTGTDTDCQNGVPTYYGWYEMYPHPSFSFGGGVSPGDTINASVVFSGSNSYTLTLKDVTKGWTATTTKKLSNAARSSAEVIIEAPSSGGILPLADFGTVNVSSSIVDGSAIGGFNPAQIFMVNGSGQDKDTVSSLSSGENFSATWIRSN
jgi:hypothetical protein